MANSRRIIFVSLIVIIIFLASSASSVRKPMDKSKIDSQIISVMGSDNDKEMIDVIISFKTEKKSVKGILGITTKDIPAKEYFSDIIDSRKGRAHYKFNEINAIAARITPELAAELSTDPDIEFIGKPPTFYVDLTESIPLINADDTWQRTVNNHNITGRGQTICVLDTGVDYTHSDLGGCNPVNHTYYGNVEDNVTESQHNYADDTTEKHKITMENFTSIAVHFKNISMEDEWDFIKVFDGNMIEVATYTGEHEDVWSPSVEGDTIYVYLDADSSVNQYGFYIDKVINGSANMTINWSACEKVIGGWDIVNSDSDPMDDHNHGTHCAGIAAANGTVKGVAPDANIIAVKVCNSSGGCPGIYDLTGMEWCINNSERYNISVLSMSFGGGYRTSYCDTANWYTQLMSDMTERAKEKNISVVIATGNSAYTTGIGEPACIENATKVGNTEKDDDFYSTGNRGANFPDIIMAPGTSIYSTVTGGSHAYYTGTSMATPHVSGAIALMNQVYKNNYNIFADPLFLRQRLNDTGVRLYDSGSGITYSRVDADTAVFSLIIPQIDVGSPLNSSVNGVHVDFNFTTDKPLNRSWLQVDSEGIVYLSNDTDLHWYYDTYNDLSHGLHNATLYAEDFWGNTNQTTVWFFVDEQAPNITMLYPVNGTIALTNESISLNFTYTDDYSSVDSCWYSIDGETNRTINSCINTSFNATEGEHNITVYSNDTIGNTGSNTSFFNVTLNPSITLISPENTTYNITEIHLNFSYESYYANDSCRYNLNSNATNTTINCTNETLINASEGGNNVTLWINNSLGRTGTDTVFFSVDTIYPKISFINSTPDSGEIINTSSFNINISNNETNPDSFLLYLERRVYLELNYSENYTNITLDLSDGFYEYFAIINDTANNTNNTLTRNITIDTIYPSISSVDLFPPLLIGEDNVSWQANISDNINLSLSWFQIMNSTNDIVYTKYLNNSQGIKNESYNTSSLSEGIYRIFLFANDTVNHTVNLSAGSFEVSEPVSINISLLEPSGNSTNATLRLFYNGTNSQKISVTNQSLNSTIAKGLWKLRLETMMMNTTMDNVNLRNSTANGSITFNDSISVSSINPALVSLRARSVAKAVSVETEYNFTSGTVSFSYNDTGMNENYLSVWACHSWNITTETCTGSWENVTDNSTINTTTNITEINTTSFSAFTLIQDKYCGDGTCDSGLETCSTCSADCGSCPVNNNNNPGSTVTPSGGGPPPKRKELKIISDNEDIISGQMQKVMFALENTGEANLSGILLNLSYSCDNCSLLLSENEVDKLEVNETRELSFDALFNNSGAYDVTIEADSGSTHANRTIILKVESPPDEVTDDNTSCDNDGICEPENDENESNCPGDCRKKENICVQVITPAINPDTGECIEYPTPCDVPDGWDIVGNCSVESEDKRKIDFSGYFIYAGILIIAGILIVLLYIFLTKEERKIKYNAKAIPRF